MGAEFMIAIYGKRKILNDFKIQFFAGTFFLVFVVLSLLGVFELRVIFFFLIPMILFYGYVFSMLSQKEEVMKIDEHTLTYKKGEHRRINIPTKSIKSFDFTGLRQADGFSIYDPIFIVYMKDGSDISASYRLFKFEELLDFEKKAMKLLDDIQLV